MTPVKFGLMLAVLPLLAGARGLPPPPSVATAGEAIEIAREVCGRPAEAIVGPWLARLENGRWVVWKRNAVGQMVQTRVDAAAGTAEPCVYSICRHGPGAADQRACR